MQERTQFQKSTINKQLTCDMIRQRRVAAALCSNNAKSCFDRMVRIITYLSIQQSGAPKNAIRSMILTLQKAQHFVSTAFGRSSNSYGTQMAEPMQGIGQEN